MCCCVCLAFFCRQICNVLIVFTLQKDTMQKEMTIDTLPPAIAYEVKRE